MNANKKEEQVARGTETTKDMEDAAAHKSVQKQPMSGRRPKSAPQQKTCPLESAATGTSPRLIRPMSAKVPESQKLTEDIRLQGLPRPRSLKNRSRAGLGAPDPPPSTFIKKSGAQGFTTYTGQTSQSPRESTLRQMQLRDLLNPCNHHRKTAGLQRCGKCTLTQLDSFEQRLADATSPRESVSEASTVQSEVDMDNSMVVSLWDLPASRRDPPMLIRISHEPVVPIKPKMRGRVCRAGATPSNVDTVDDERAEQMLAEAAELARSRKEGFILNSLRRVQNPVLQRLVDMMEISDICKALSVEADPERTQGQDVEVGEASLRGVLSALLPADQFSAWDIDAVVLVFTRFQERAMPLHMSEFCMAFVACKDRQSECSLPRLFFDSQALAVARSSIIDTDNYVTKMEMHTLLCLLEQEYGNDAWIAEQLRHHLDTHPIWRGYISHSLVRLLAAIEETSPELAQAFKHPRKIPFAPPPPPEEYW